MSNHEQVLSEAKQLSCLPMMDNILGQPTSHEALLNFHDVEGKSVLEACARMIRDARGQVIFSGMGASLFAAFPAVSQMEQHGCSVQILESSELLHYRTATLRAGDVGVLISRSGGSVEVLRLAEKMRSAGMVIIGVTNLPRTPLAALADITLAHRFQRRSVDSCADLHRYSISLAAAGRAGDRGPESKNDRSKPGCHAAAHFSNRRCSRRERDLA